MIKSNFRIIISYRYVYQMVIVDELVCALKGLRAQAMDVSKLFDFYLFISYLFIHYLYKLTIIIYLHMYIWAKICLTGDTIRRIDIVSRCFENKNNNCCEAKLCKNAIIAICILFGIHDLATQMPEHPSRRVAGYGFVINKQMAFLQILFHNNYCSYFQNKTT